MFVDSLESTQIDIKEYARCLDVNWHSFSRCPSLHLRLCILMMLRGVRNAFGAHFGIKCSSFCRVNVGTSMRSACTALGFSNYESVRLSNKLLERTFAYLGRDRIFIYKYIIKNMLCSTITMWYLLYKHRRIECSFYDPCIYVCRQDVMTFLVSFILAPQYVIYIYLAVYAIYIMNISVHQHIMQLCKCAQCLSCRRTCTLIFLCCSLGGVWSLEQPSGSLLEFYPTWRFTLNAICKCLGHHSVRVLFFQWWCNVSHLPKRFHFDAFDPVILQSTDIYIIYWLIMYYML